MEQPPRRSAVDDILGDSDLMTLVELQKFLADELADGNEGAKDFSRAFLPLTDGLGLESPPPGQVAKPPAYQPKIEAPKAYPHAESASSSRGASALDEFDAIEELPRAERHTDRQADRQMDRSGDRSGENRSLANLLDRPETPEPASRVSARSVPLFEDADLDLDTSRQEAVIPPPVPKVGFSRRLLSGLIDEVFVLSLWLLSIAITSNVLSGSSVDLMQRLPKDFANPMFQRFVVLEFAAIWLGYLTICAILDMTFGMWVWGLRVGYREESTKLGRFFSRATRVLFSFVFYAPMLPSVVLVVRLKGRNLLDWISGTHLYRTGA